MAKRLLILSLAAVVTLGWAGSNPNQPVDRPFTLLNQSPFLLEAEYHRMIQGTGPRSYIFPRPCTSALDSSRACAEPGGWRFADSVHHRTIGFSPMVGYEYRYLGENVHAADFGIVTQGGSGPVSFYLDARMFTERYENPDHSSYDREFVERQDEKASGSVAYTSYSRYRSNLSYDWSWGRLTVARDAAHWGPGLFTNLTFQQEAIPFNQMTFTTHLGPLSVQTMYGQLGTTRDWDFDTTSESKSLYAHRYEWRASANLLFGISEQMILYKVSAPFAFVPIIPLFITKASEKERLNNGNIAGDVSYRIPGIGSIYSEFLIDDMQSPTSLFDAVWSNKWAWMAGMHWIKDSGRLRTGFLIEYARVEPWVYTHYLTNTAQTSHQGYPLGNLWGPNSQVIVLNAYIAAQGKWHVSSRMDWVWKGSDPGSSIEDVRLNGDSDKKIFLNGLGSPEFEISPDAWYRWGCLTAYIRLRFGSGTAFSSGIQYEY